MKKIFASILAIAMAVVVLAGCGNSASSSASGDSSSSSDSTTSTAEYGKGYVFKHGFDKAFPPFASIDDNGETSGFDIELAKAVCDYNGWEYKAVPLDWDSKDMELNAGSCDCIWSGFTMNGLEDKYQWSKPYCDNLIKILVKKDSNIKSLADLAGKKVGVQAGTSALRLLDEGGAQNELRNTFGDLVIEDSYPVCFNDLKSGGIDAIVIDVTTGDEMLEGEKDYGYLDESIGKEEYAIGFRTSDTELCKKVDEAIDALVADGTFDKIGQKYPNIYEYLSLGK